MNVNLLIAVGEPARPIANGAALEGSWDGEARVGAGPGRGGPAGCSSVVRPGDVVLVKGSRVTEMQQVRAGV